MTDYVGELKNMHLTSLWSDDEIAGPKPTPAFVKDVRENGFIMPIKIAYLDEEGCPAFLVDGGRRIKTARILGMDSIECLVNRRVPRELAMKWRLAANAQRAPNLVAVLQAVKEQLAAGQSDSKTIAQTLGITVGAVKQAIEFGRCPEPVLKALADGRVSASTAKAVARMNGLQSVAVARLVDKGRLTGADIDELHRIGQQETAAAQPSLVAVAAAPAPASIYFTVCGAELRQWTDRDEAMTYADENGGLAYQGKEL